MPRKKSPYPVYSTVKLDTFEKGLITDHPSTISPDSLVQAKNIVFTQEGYVKPRPGIRKRFSQDFSSTGVKGIGALYKSDRTSNIVIASGQTLYKDTPHIVFEYDSQQAWDSGTHNLDTSSEPGKIKLLSAPTPSFSRSTVAYNDDGTQVAANTPRYKELKKVYVEDSQSKFATGTLTEVVASPSGDLRLAQEGADYSKTETTQEDFQSGTLTNVVATSTGELQLSIMLSNIIEDFEDDIFQFSFVGDWIRVTTTPHSGSYCFKSKTIPDGATSQTQITVNVPLNGNVTFWYRVSSEANYDKFYFYIDGVAKIDGVSGNIPWTQVSFPLTPGQHTLKWVYTKDASVSVGEDSAYIDDLSISYTGYYSSGFRLSPIYDISSVGVVCSSSISWSATTPTNTNVTIETNLSLDGGATWQGWQVCTNGGTIPGITKGTDLSNARLQIRQTLSTTDIAVTPQLHDLTISITSVYKTSGNRVSPPVSVRLPGQAKSSLISWTADTPTGTSLSIEISWDDGATWLACTNGGALPGIDGRSLLNASFLLRESLSTTDVAITPKLSYLKVEITSSFEQGVIVEEGTRNLLKNASFNVYTGTNGVADGWASFADTGITASFAVDSTVSHSSGGKSQKITISASTDTGGALVYQDVSGATAGTTYTGSAYVKGSGTDVVVYVGLMAWNSSGNFLGIFGVRVAGLTKDWSRVTVTGTAPSGTASIGLYVMLYVTKAGGTGTLYVDDAQIEQKSYATSVVFVNDTTTQPTRAADSFCYTLSKSLPTRNAGCMWWKPAHSSSDITRLVQLMAAFNTASSPVQRYSVIYQNGGFSFGKNDGTTWYWVSSGSISFSADDIIFIAWLDDPLAGYMKLWVGKNGSALLEYALSNTVQITDAQKIYVGCYSSTGYEANGIIDDVQIYDVGIVLANGGTVDTGFWNVIYTSLIEQEWSLYTLLHSNLNNTLEVDADRQGIWISPVMDGSSAVDLATTVVTWAENVPANTAVVCQVRSSPDRVNWSAWYDQGNNLYSNAPANPYVQIRFILQELSNSGTPTVSKAVVSFEGTPTAETLLTGLSPTDYYTFAQLQDYLIICNGMDTPKKFDGTTISDITQAPRAALVTTFRNRVFMAKTSTNPSRLFFSDLLNIDSWPSENFIDVNPNDGDEIVALLPTTSTLLIVKQHNIYQLQGYSPSTFQVTLVGKGGTISPWGIVDTPYGLFRLDREGVWATDLRRSVKITQSIENIWRGLNQRMLHLAALYYFDDRLLVAVPSANSNVNDTILVYDLRHKAWSIWTGWNTACFIAYFERGKWSYLFGDSKVGNVYHIGEAVDDAGVPFEVVIETAYLPLISEEIEKRVKWVDVSLGGAAQDTTVKLSAVVDGAYTPDRTFTVPANTVSQSFRVYVPALANTLGIKLTMPNANADGPTLLGIVLTFFQRSIRPKVVY